MHATYPTLIEHYDPDIGVGNVYKLMADWPEVVKVVFFGWENTLTHPAQLHYAFDYTDGSLNDAMRTSNVEAYANLHLPRARPARVMDTGCGIGGTTFVLAQAYPQTQFVGVSLSPGQVAVATRRAANAKLTNVSYIVANYLKLPFPDASFDGVMGIETYIHIDDREKPRLFSELNRILKKNGRVATFDAYLADKPRSKMKLAPLHREIFRGWSLPDKISTASFFVSLAQKHGFTVRMNRVMTERILGCSKEAARRASWFMHIKPLIYLSIAMRRRGVRLPFFSQLGLDHPVIFAFARTALQQYDLFASGDGEYREIVLQKR